MTDDRDLALRRLRDAGTAITAGVTTRLGPYLIARAARILDAWGALTPVERSRVDEQLAAAAGVATRRVVGELAALLATDPAAQRATPLEIVRGATREPTAVLAAAGIPSVVRDEFEERALPEDRYGLAPHAFADLGDDALGPLQLAWGLAKAAALRAEGSDAAS